jgi:hypothetical protein
MQDRGQSVGAYRVNDFLVDTAALAKARVSPMLEVQMLHWDPAGGSYSIMMHYKAGAVAGPHRHLAPAEFYVVSGLMEYEAGTAGPGFWGVEPNGAVHQATRFPEDTVLLFRCAGATARLDAEGNVIGVVEGRHWYELCAGAGAVVLGKEG